MGLTRYSQRNDVGAAGPALSADRAAGAKAKIEMTARAAKPTLIPILCLELRDGAMRNLLRNRFLLIITGLRRGSIEGRDGTEIGDMNEFSGIRIVSPMRLDRKAAFL
jgi:hypothetical protein